jgi:hypothetical protein
MKRHFLFGCNNLFVTPVKLHGLRAFWEKFSKEGGEHRTTLFSIVFFIKRRKKLIIWI